MPYQTTEDIDRMGVTALTGLATIGTGIAAGSAGGPLGAVIGGFIGLFSAIGSIISTDEALRARDAQEEAVQSAKAEELALTNQAQVRKEALNQAVSGAFGKQTQEATKNFLQGLRNGQTFNGAMANAGMVQGMAQAEARRADRVLDRYMGNLNGGITPSLATRLNDPLIRGMTASSKGSGTSNYQFRENKINSAATASALFYFRPDPNPFNQSQQSFAALSSGGSSTSSTATSSIPMMSNNVDMGTSTNPISTGSIEARLKNGSVTVNRQSGIQAQSY